ncbi:mitochondrial respiratory chain complex II assembly [Neonectria magnoliae]|uniref:Mitochondrial respiratory chain complex II assembly n=1 Tax=Neonectria magnoliae TaxID=2732573 RepID=A0ABR1HEY7_9HYPO
MRLSGLQKEVVALYRHCLRESRKKPVVGPPIRIDIWKVVDVDASQASRPHFENFARAEFVRNLSIDKRDFAAIEFLLRKGRRQLDVYSSPGIKDITP